MTVNKPAGVPTWSTNLDLLCSFPPQNTDILNTAVLTGKNVSVPVKTLAVEADGSVTDVTNYTSCESTEEDVLKVSSKNQLYYRYQPLNVVFVSIKGLRFCVVYIDSAF